MQLTSQRLTFQEKQYLNSAVDLIGKEYDLEKWERSGEQKAHLERQSKIIADKLEKGYQHHGLGWSRNVSVNPYASTDLYLMGLFSKGVKKLDNYRNLSIIPIKARTQRMRTTKELEHFLYHHPYTRMWLFTDKRTNLMHLRHVLKKMHRKLSKLNDQDFMKYYGARFVFRTSELGEIFPLGKSDISVHPHMHALMVLDKKLSKKEFINLNKLIQSYWKAYSADSGIVKNARELTKYVAKPNDLESLNAEQIVKLYHAQNGLHLVQPLQDFKLHRQQIREDNKKVVIRKGRPKLVPNWNRSNTTNKRQPDRFVEYVDMLDDSRKADTLRECSHATPRIVAWCTPSPIFTPVSEPVFMVHGLEGRDPVPMFDREEVIRMEQAIMVHTNTLTVRKNSENKSEINRKYESEPKIPPKNLQTARVYQLQQEPF